MNNPSNVQSPFRKDKIEGSAESLQKTNSNVYELTPLLKPSLGGKIDEVIIPSVPESAS